MLYPIVPCKCSTWALYGRFDRDRHTGHHVCCVERGPRETREGARTPKRRRTDGGPYRSPPSDVRRPRTPSRASPLAAFVEAEAAARRAQSSVVRTFAGSDIEARLARLASGRWTRMDGRPAHDGEGRAVFWYEPPPADPDPWLERYPVWISGREARGAGCGLDACPDGGPETRRAWITGWHHADAERASRK